MKIEATRCRDAGRKAPTRKGTFERRSMGTRRPPPPPPLSRSHQESPLASLHLSSSSALDSHRILFPTQYQHPSSSSRQVSATTRRTPCAGAAAGPPSTSRSRRAPRAATPPRACADVSRKSFVCGVEMSIGDDAGERCAEVGEVAKGGEKKEKRHQLLRPRSPSFVFRSPLSSFPFFFNPDSPSPQKQKKQTTGPSRPRAARPRARAACATSRTSRAAPRTASARAPRPRRRRREGGEEMRREMKEEV